ncbi:MAG TPA: SufD family Fe-S cluster assembly protein [Patescibacteria group bacterium]|jgi:Fe-S cluster assembly scaffold protein SufB
MKTFTVKKDEHREIKLTEPGQYTVELVGPGAEANLTSVFQTKAKENLELSVIIHHKSPHTRAETTMKGVARDQSRIKFNGKIIIDPDCGDSQSFLTERVLLLSPQAKAEAVPDLEILTDDVRCSHAASVSNIPEEHIFYLQARGLNRLKAEEMIVEGFLGKSN